MSHRLDPRRLVPWRLPLLVLALILVVGGADALLAGDGPGPSSDGLPAGAVAALPSAASPGPSQAIPAPADTGLGSAVLPGPSLAAETPAPAPEVVRFRPRNGWTGVAPSAEVSVRFTTPMDHATTEAAFSAIVAGGEAVGGTFRWAEGDTVLVLDPGAAMPYGARVTLLVGPEARSAAGTEIAAASSITFTVAAKAAPKPAATGSPTSSAGWQWPLLGPITQYFGQTLTQYGVHQGIDIDGQVGDPVHAAHSGKVVVAGHYDACGGLEVHIDHGGGLVSWYRHLSRIDVSVGATVAAGTRIGLVGDTGCSTGSHLHFAIRIGTTFVDPLRYLPRR